MENCRLFHLFYPVPCGDHLFQLPQHTLPWNCFNLKSRKNYCLLSSCWRHIHLSSLLKIVFPTVVDWCWQGGETIIWSWNSLLLLHAWDITQEEALLHTTRGFSWPMIVLHTNSWQWERVPPVTVLLRISFWSRLAHSALKSIQSTYSLRSI